MGEPAPLRVAVGSKNPVKVAAVRQAFFRAFPDRPLVCVGHDVPSGVPDQPWGRDETQSGALQRARGACMAETGADYAVGIEGGVEEGNYGLRSVAYVAIRRGRDLRMSVEHTASFVLPPRVARRDTAAPELDGVPRQSSAMLPRSKEWSEVRALLCIVAERRGGLEACAKYF